MKIKLIEKYIEEYKEWLLDMDEELFEANKKNILATYKDCLYIEMVLEVMRIKIERRINKLKKI
jgi:hypothetical protein